MLEIPWFDWIFHILKYSFYIWKASHIPKKTPLKSYPGRRGDGCLYCWSCHHQFSFSGIFYQTLEPRAAFEVLWEHGKGGNQLDPLSCTSFCSSSWYLLNRRKICFEYSHFSQPIHLNRREFHSAPSMNIFPFTCLSSYDFPTSNPLSLLFRVSFTTISFGLEHYGILSEELVLGLSSCRLRYQHRLRPETQRST